MSESDIVEEINAEIRRVSGSWPENQFCLDLAARSAAAITALRAENEKLRAALRWFVDEYERTHFIRTADLHEQDCHCLRCAYAYDNARAALTKGEKPRKTDRRFNNAERIFGDD